MALITLSEVSLVFRGPALLDGVSCQLEPGQRVGLLGRNGAGKTTLMRILHGDVQPDSGAVIRPAHVRVSLLPQDIPLGIEGPVSEVVKRGVNPTLSSDPATAWQTKQQVEQILSRMELDADIRFESLSSGMKRRVLLAQCLVSSPDLLLLDEPTNHLDINAIQWLEAFLLRWKNTLLFVTHDRAFLRNVATRIMEIDRGHLFDWSCNYDTFIRRKEQWLAAEEKQNAVFDKKLAEEEAWIRQGIKARRTRNEGRARALQKMRTERRERPAKSGEVGLKIQQGQRSGNLVAGVESVSFAFGHTTIVRDFSTLIMRGDKVGIIGPNGAGKTTLLRLMLGELKPQQGSVRLGTNLQIAYFDQLRQQLDEEKTIQHNVGDGYETIRVGNKSQHVIGYLQNFLFSPERARTPIKFLSGGERNRVLLAKLFAKPANLIVLDEPTNDLDTETLELLEQRLVEFPGTVLLVSHDREFLNNVVTSVIVFEDGKINEYVGGYDDWVRQSAAPEPKKSSSNRPKPKQATRSPRHTEALLARKRRLTFKEQQELAVLPQTIEQLEQRIAALHETFAQPEFYRQPSAEIATRRAELQDLEGQVADAYTRWEELEQVQQN